MNSTIDFNSIELDFNILSYKISCVVLGTKQKKTKKKQINYSIQLTVPVDI